MKVEEVKRTSVLKYMRNEDIKTIREELYKINNGFCPVLKKEVPLTDCVLDHKHKKNKQSELGMDDYGCIRNTIDKRVNSFEGKVLKDYIRSGLSKDIDLSDLLRNLADYIDAGSYVVSKFNHDTTDIEYIRYIHPTDTPKQPLMRKRDFNKLNKLYKFKYSNRKPLDFPKSSKLTKKFIELFKEFNITI